ncbi:AAA family ATPase [Gluconobacter kondonii]|uniref:AAA family ATPase n=1 Tax=Gluconobacter kondonii TaxID=941463 RepID=UPI001B8C93B3|nr:AAA family ATPase [Gluconobacter kondonii]MBS1082489.1 AAA family ATPase [Gluconobacter kondonii]
MKINSLIINNFQAFEKTEEIKLSDKMNLIIGQNNSGKSSILRSLNFNIANDSHISYEGKKNSPDIIIDIEINSSELLLEIKNGPYKSVIYSPVKSRFSSQGIDDIEDFFRGYDLINFKIKNTPSEFKLENNEYNYFQKKQLTEDDPIEFLTIKNHSGDTYCEFEINYFDKKEDTILFIKNLWNRKFFHFVAERLNTSKCALERTTLLAPNAQNLPSVLHTLRGERGSVLNKIINHLKEIIPSVGNISTVISPDRNDMVEIRVWPTEEMDGLDRSFSLSQSGGGISQVLSILCSIATSDNSIIAIDEIDTFLHPAAVKSLLRIIQTEYQTHQYIITTHSPEVISFSNPDKVLLVRRDGYSSSIEEVKIDDINILRDASNHLGVSMNDVFAAKRIIWVEGQTEEFCFPWIYNEICGKKTPIGTFFTAVVATGSFLEKRKDRELVYKIYQSLTQATSLYTEHPVFSFDAEGLSLVEQSEMNQRSSGSIHFLPRRMLECYVLNPEAIKNLIHEKNEDYRHIESSLVEETIMEFAKERKFLIKDIDPDFSSIDWLKSIDAAKIIKLTIEKLTECTVEFKKTTDVLFLLKNIHLNYPDNLLELSDYVKKLVETQKSINENK